MVAVPAAIIMINGDTSPSARAFLVKQLHIDEVIDGYVWDARLAADPEYDNLVRRLNLRLLVIQPTFAERGTDPNWNKADIVAFVKNGLVNVEKNTFGPPIRQARVVTLTWGKLCVFDRTYR